MSHTEKQWETFVWVRGLRGPTPQAWGREVNKDGHGKTVVGEEILATFPMTDEDQKLTLSQLAEKYPLPEVKQDGTTG